VYHRQVNGSLSIRSSEMHGTSSAWVSERRGLRSSGLACTTDMGSSTLDQTNAPGTVPEIDFD
jgi:hypothetical protein